MKVIVITGSTKGIGYGLAEAFLAKGCSVVICGHSAVEVEEALQQLQAKYTTGRVAGMVCDVRNYDEVAALWKLATSHFDKVHIWINNAGQSHPRKKFWEQTPETIYSVAGTNITGSMNGANVALKGMMAQGFGSVYNMLGLGSTGAKLKGYALYGSTKYAMSYFSSALVKEMEGTPVQVGTIFPGIVITDLLAGNDNDDPKRLDKLRWIYNALGDKVETVTPWIADQLLLNNNTNGTHISWLSRTKIFFRLLAWPFRKRKLI